MKHVQRDNLGQTPCNHRWVANWYRHEQIGRVCVGCGISEPIPRPAVPQEPEPREVQPGVWVSDRSTSIFAPKGVSTSEPLLIPGNAGQFVNAAPLRELIATWRERAQTEADAGYFLDAAVIRCADELASVIEKEQK